jgi:hypothetical protein
VLGSFTNQKERLQRTLHNALAGATYRSSNAEEDGRMLVLEAARGDGRIVSVRFRGVSKSEATREPRSGSPLSIKAVTLRGRSLLALLLPSLRAIPAGSARVRIDIGGARLDIICQDAEWWEGEAALSPDSGGTRP